MLQKLHKNMATPPNLATYKIASSDKGKQSGMNILTELTSTMSLLIHRSAWEEVNVGGRGRRPGSCQRELPLDSSACTFAITRLILSGTEYVTLPKVECPAIIRSPRPTWSWKHRYKL